MDFISPLERLFTLGQSKYIFLAGCLPLLLCALCFELFLTTLVSCFWFYFFFFYPVLFPLVENFSASLPEFQSLWPGETRHLFLLFSLLLLLNLTLLLHFSFAIFLEGCTSVVWDTTLNFVYLFHMRRNCFHLLRKTSQGDEMKLQRQNPYRWAAFSANVGLRNQKIILGRNIFALRSTTSTTPVCEMPWSTIRQNFRSDGVVWLFRGHSSFNI